MAKSSNTLKLKFDSARQFAPAPESKNAATIKPQYDLFINGEFVKPLSKKYFATHNPATEEKLSEVADANEADVDRAVKAARAGAKVWSGMQPKERSKYIYRIARMIQERAREFAVIETLDGVNPSAKAVILMCQWLPIISFIMQVGPINWSMLFPTGKLHHWVLQVKSSHGIFHC